MIKAQYILKIKKINFCIYEREKIKIYIFGIYSGY